MKSVVTPSVSEIRIRLHEAERLWAAIGRLVDGRELDSLTLDEFVDLALEVAPLFPSELRRRVVEYRRYAPDGDGFLLRGLIPVAVSLPATATSPSVLPSGAAQHAALLLTGVTAMLGEPFNYSTLYGGRLVQNIVPVHRMEFTQTSQSSIGTLDWHCEDSYREDRCDYVGLLCLRGDDSGVATKYAQVRDVHLPADLVATLREPRFHVKPDPAHVSSDVLEARRVAVLSGPESAPEIAYDAHRLVPVDDADREAADALRELDGWLDRVAISHVMESGDLLILDNKRVAHARTPFAARFDGTDRWLMRTMVCGSAVTFRRWGTRVPE